MNHRGTRGFSSIGISSTEIWCFLWYMSEQKTNKQTVWFDMPVCSYDVTVIRICNLVKYISRGHYYAWLTDTHRALSNPHCTRWCNYDEIGSAPLYYHNTEIFSVLLALCEVNPLPTSGFPSEGTIARRCCHWCMPEQMINKQCWYRWFDRPVCSCDVTVIRNPVKYI